MRLAVACTAACVLLGGCQPTEPHRGPAGTYELVSVGGHKLPYVPEIVRLLGGSTAVAGGTVALGGNGLISETTLWSTGEATGASGSYSTDENRIYVWRPGAVAPAYSFEWDLANTIRRNANGEEWRYERR